jgi:hypothetical protein
MSAATLPHTSGSDETLLVNTGVPVALASSELTPQRCGCEQDGSRCGDHAPMLATLGL